MFVKVHEINDDIYMVRDNLVILCECQSSVTLICIQFDVIPTASFKCKYSSFFQNEFSKFSDIRAKNLWYLAEYLDR